MRKTVTISRNIFEMLKEINFNDRHIIWDMILDSLFDGKKPQIKGDDIHSDSIRNAFICLNHELNILQKQFDNGKKSVQKNSKQKNTGLLCPDENPQLDPTSPSLTQLDPPAENDINVTYNINNKSNNNKNINNNTNKQTLINTNNINNNIYNNKLNKQEIINNNIINNNETAEKYTTKDTCYFKLTEQNREVTKFWLENLTQKIKDIEEYAPNIAVRFAELVNRVAGELNPLKVQGYYTAPEIILEKYIELFRCEPAEAVERLEAIFEKIDKKVVTGDISNAYKYQVALIYNIASDEALLKKLSYNPPLPIIEDKQTKSGFMTREYTKEEMALLYDSLDDVEI